MKDKFSLVFLLPTCEPDEMFKWLYPTLNKLDGTQDYVKFSITFQPPYSRKEYMKVVDLILELGFELKWEFKTYTFNKPYTPLIKMRNDCAMRFPDADIYGLLDDDMSFEDTSIVDYLNKTVEAFKKDPNLGVVSFNETARTYENYFATNSGIFYRGGKYYGFQGLVPKKLDMFPNYHTYRPYEGEDLLKLFGGYQDKFCAMIRLCTGNMPLQFVDVPVNHIENRKERGAIGHGWDPARFEQGSIGQFINKYFNRYFIITSSMSLFEPDLMDQIFPDYFTNDDTYLVYK